MSFANLLAGQPGILALVLTVLGACWGSFAATLSERWPHGKSVIMSRPKCDACGRRRAAVEFIPLISFMTSRGRSRCCSVKIPYRRPTLELAGSCIGAISFLAGSNTEALWMAVFGWQALLLAIVDAEHFWLPNPLVALLGLTGLAVFGGEPDAQNHIAGGVIGFAALYGIAKLYRWLSGRDGLGGGDPKLFGAIGIWVGWRALPEILLLSAIMGILFAIFTSEKIPSDEILSRKLPFGTFLCAAAWIHIFTR